MTEPTIWQNISTYEALKQFQIEFREMPEAKREIIIIEMLAVIETYRLGTRVITASTSREEPPLLRKRRGRAKSPRSQRV